MCSFLNVALSPKYLSPGPYSHKARSVPINALVASNIRNCRQPRSYRIFFTNRQEWLFASRSISRAGPGSGKGTAEMPVGENRAENEAYSVSPVQNSRSVAAKSAVNAAIPDGLENHSLSFRLAGGGESFEPSLPFLKGAESAELYGLMDCFRIARYSPKIWIIPRRLVNTSRLPVTNPGTLPRSQLLDNFRAAGKRAVV
jgi:hypothetical protein